MNRIDLPKPVAPREPAPGTERCPGRNRVGLGRWLIDRYLPEGGSIVDVMCGSGQWWLDRPEGVAVVGCERVAERVTLARANGVIAQVGDAETFHPDFDMNTFQPYWRIDLVAFSPPFPQSNKMSGKTQKQLEQIERDSLHAMQDVGPMPNMHRVLSNIASWRGSAPVAVLCKNYIRREGKVGQVEVDWTSEVEALMLMCGIRPVERFWYPVKPGRFEMQKRARNPKHRIIDREILLVGGAS